MYPCDIGVNIRKSNVLYDINSDKFVPLYGKGIVARTCLYMSEKYEIELDNFIKDATFKEWMKEPIEPYLIRHYSYVKMFQEESRFDSLLIGHGHKWVILKLVLFMSATGSKFCR